MEKQFVYVPQWVNACISPPINWALSAPYPQSHLKRVVLRFTGLAVSLLVECGVVRYGGMGAQASMKRSETDPALSTSHSLSDCRVVLPSPTYNALSRHDKQTESDE